MESLRVPTHSLEVEIRYFDERPLPGRVFVASFAKSHDGPERIEDWINRPVDFFPFLPDGSETTTLLNKRYVVVLSTSHEGEEPPPGIVRPVIVECGTLRLGGNVYIDMPEHASRLLDWVNRSEPFLVLYDETRKHIVRKSRITFVREAE